jgi:hypothetical protein
VVLREDSRPTEGTLQLRYPCVHFHRASLTRTDRLDGRSSPPGREAGAVADRLAGGLEAEACERRELAGSETIQHEPLVFGHRVG